MKVSRSAVLEHVAETISRYSMFRPGEKAGVAVSGGADSVCLLHVLLELAPLLGIGVTALHLNHCLRGEESEGDERFVRDLAQAWGVEVRVARLDVRAMAERTGDNLEQAARCARRDFFLEALRQREVDRVALGHTRSDQAETVLFRFLRGSGTAGLSGIRPVTREGLVRPLIEVERADVERYLRDRGIDWREDSSNADQGFARNRIRHSLLPQLTSEWNPSLTEALARMAEVAQDEEDYWSRVVELGVDTASPVPPSEGRLSMATPGQQPEQEDDIPSHSVRIGSDAVFFRAGCIAKLHPALARRMVRRLIELAKGDLRGIDYSHIEAIRRLAEAQAGGGRLQVPGLDVFRSFGWVRLCAPGLHTLENRNYAITVSPPEEVCIPGSEIRISLKVKECSDRFGIELPGDSRYNYKDSDLDWGRISGELQVRNWRPGDQYRPVGHARETKIKDLFQQSKIPLWDRRKWPVLTSGETIVWCARFGAASDYAAAPGANAVLEVRESGISLEF